MHAPLGLTMRRHDLNNNVSDYHSLNRNNGVVFEAEENVSISNYVDEMGKVVPPETILIASRIVGNRISVYFSKRCYAEEAVTKGIAVSDFLVWISPRLPNHSVSVLKCVPRNNRRCSC